MSSLYAILLGLILVAAWQNFQEAERKQIDEANHVVSLFRLAGSLSEPTGGQIRLGLYHYAKSTVDEEWPLLDALSKASQGESTGLPKAFADYNDIWSQYLRYKPKDARSQIALNHSIQELIKFGEDRRLRLLDAKPYLPRDVWRLLFGGAVLVMVMAALFTIGRHGLFAVTSFALGASVALELAVVVSVDHPYAGPTLVRPNALRNAVKVMEQIAAKEGLPLDDSNTSQVDQPDRLPPALPGSLPPGRSMTPR